jgi:hypothetical protein
VGACGQRVDDLFDHRVQGAAGALAGGEVRQLPGVGKLAVPEQVGDFFEAAPGGQFLDGIAAVQQGIGLGVDLLNGRIVHYNAVETLFDVLFSHAEAPFFLSPLPASAGHVLWVSFRVPGS